jgi:hypothetical protein
VLLSVYSIKIKDVKSNEVQTKVDLVVLENVFYQMNITRVRSMWMCACIIVSPTLTTKANSGLI